MNLLAYILFSIIPREEIARDCCDVIEHNRFYDEQGRLVFAQLIFMDWVPQCGRYQVRAWKLLKGDKPTPERDWRQGGYTATWVDDESVRRIRSDSIRDSWTQFDPELLERDVLPKERRLGLRILSMPK